MKKTYEEAEVTVTRFEYEGIMEGGDIEVGEGSIPDTGDGWEDL